MSKKKFIAHQGHPLSTLADALTQLGALLLRYGSSTFRIEACLREAAQSYAATAEVFATPTGLWMSLEQKGQEPVIRLVRVNSWRIALDKLEAVDIVFNEILDKRCTPKEAMVKLRRIETRAPRYKAPVMIFAGALASAASALIVGGLWPVAYFAFALGLLTTSTNIWLGRGSNTRWLGDFSTGVLVGFAAWALGHIDPSLPRRPLILGGLIISVPGLGLTSGLAELAQKNLVSGAARLFDAGMVMVSLLFGVAAVSVLEQRFAPKEFYADISTRPDFLLSSAAALLGGLGFILLFSVPRKKIPWSLSSTLLAVTISSLASTLNLPASAGNFIAAFCIGIFANTYARVSDRPAQLLMIPGIVILVPGSFGYISLDLIMSGQVQAGIQGSLETMLNAGALVTGLLVANVAVAPKKVL